MSFSNFSDPFVDRMTHRWMMVSKLWGLKAVPLVEGLTLWLGWTGLTWLAFGCSLLFVEVGERSDLSLVEGVIGGLLIGGAQWWMLRSHLPKPYRWLVATVLGWGALTLFRIGALGWMAPGTPNLFFRVLLGLLYGAYVGTVLGTAQWLAMRKQVVRAWRWVPLSSGIWAVAIAFGWLIGGSLRAVSHLFVSEVIGLVIAWGAIAALSGIGIVGLVYQAHSSHPYSTRRPEAYDSAQGLGSDH